MSYVVVLVDLQWGRIQRSLRVKWVLICRCNGIGDRGQIAPRLLCLQWCISMQDRQATLNVVCRIKNMLWWSVNERSCQKSGIYNITLADFRQQAFMRGTTMKKNETKQEKKMVDRKQKRKGRGREKRI